MNYGQIIYDPIKDSVYNSFCYYFDNPVLTKIKEDNSIDIYYAQTPCHLSNSYRYLIVTSDKTDVPIGDTVPLSMIRWNSLQTRQLDTRQENANLFLYQPKSTEPFDKIVTRIDKNDNIHTYDNKDLPFIVSLIPKTKKFNEYASKGNLATCIETYQTILTFKN